MLGFQVCSVRPGFHAYFSWLWGAPCLSIPLASGGGTPVVYFGTLIAFLCLYCLLHIFFSTLRKIGSHVPGWLDSFLFPFYPPFPDPYARASGRQGSSLLLSSLYNPCPSLDVPFFYFRLPRTEPSFNYARVGPVCLRPGEFTHKLHHHLLVRQAVSCMWQRHDWGANPIWFTHDSIEGQGWNNTLGPALQAPVPVSFIFWFCAFHDVVV